MASRRPRTPLRVSNARANAASLSTSAVFGGRANWETRTAPPGDGSAATPYVPPTHGTGVGTWGALPAAGSFHGELRPVADMTGSGRTGSGSALWSVDHWEPVGGTLPTAGGPTRHAVLTITQSVTDGVFDVTTGGAHYTHDGPDTDGTLGATAAAFAADENIDILNEIGGSVKPDVVWLSPTTFRYPGRLDPPDRLQVQMP